MSLKDRIQNWQRFQTIVTILAKHGFSGLFAEVGLLSGSKTKTEEVSGENIPRRLRLAFEELGPTFIKLGQLLSTRPDLLPEAYIAEFAKLTDQIPSFDFKEASGILDREFGRDHREIYSWLNSEPIAAASIAQVHSARLKETEQKVVVKIQRPGISKIIQGDIQVLYFIARALEKFRSDFALLNLTGIVREFQRTIYEELDFTLEAKNLDRFAENFPEIEGIEIPKVIWNSTTKKVLTMTELEGERLSQLQELPANVDRKFLTEAIVTFFFESMFFHGLFHADAHAGNVLLNTKGRGNLGILDFGMVGTLSSALRQKLSKLFLAVVAQDYEALAVAYMDIGEFGRSFSIKDFQADISYLLSPTLGRPLKEIHIGQLLLDSTRIARKYQVKLPRDLVMFYRSIVTLEAIGRKLDPEFEFISYGQKFGQSLIRRRFSSQELIGDLFKTVEGLRSLGTELPAQVRSLVNKMDREGPFAGSTMERVMKELNRVNRQNTVAILTVGLLLSATLLTSFRPDSPFIWPAWIGSGILIFCIVLSSLRTR